MTEKIRQAIESLIVIQMPEIILLCCVGSYIQIKFQRGVVLARSRKKSAIKSIQERQM
jgi:hypothetical protein